MIARYKNVVVNIASRVMAPFMMLYSLYALFHGHSSPGGGFQGGSIMAAAIMLLRLSLGRERSSRKFPVWLAPVMGTIGVMIFAGTGIFSMLGGGNYLDYGAMPLPLLS
jgi:multicomponent Na+:H+ antiporter subunit B